MKILITISNHFLRRCALVLGLIALLTVALMMIPVTIVAQTLPPNPTAPLLGEAGRFVILASQTITTTGTTAITNGDIAILDQARSCYAGFVVVGSAGGFTAISNGTSFAPDDANPAPFPNPLKFATPVIGEAWATTAAMITQIRTDLGIAYSFLAADPNQPPLAPTQVLPTELGGLTLTRGVYKTALNVLLSTPLHLDAQGDPNSVWIFSIDGTLTTGATGNIILENGAQAKNVYWRTAGTTAIAANTIFYGNVLTWANIEVLNGAQITGRLFSVTEQVTLISDAITMPAGAADTISPTVSSTDPDTNATNVPVNKIVTATFSESMDAATITTATFTVKQGVTSVSGTVTNAGNTATFTPVATLAANTVYTATITTGGMDLSGNALASNYVWNFTTDIITDVENELLVPNEFSLSQNFPNPFNPSTTIQYSLKKSGMVSLKVYNVVGKEVATLVNGRQEAGSYSLIFNTNRGITHLSTGVYFYRLEAGSFVSTKKFAIIK